MFSYAQALGEDRRAQPRRRHRLGADARRGRRRAADPQEFGSFFILLVVAGNETTRNAISHGMKLLTDHPDQRAIWFDDFDGAHQDRGRRDRPLRDAGDPLPSHRHRGHRAQRQADRRGRQGGDVVHTRPTATRRVFADPYRFDVRRPNPKAGRLRRRRPALLPRRQPGPARDHGDVRRAAAAGCPTWRSPGARLAASRLHPRHQADALRLDSRLGVTSTAVADCVIRGGDVINSTARLRRHATSACRHSRRRRRFHPPSARSPGMRRRARPPGGEGSA